MIYQFTGKSISILRVSLTTKASHFDEARTQAWGGNEEGHFVLAEIKGNRMKVIPYGNLADDALRPIKINVVTGAPNVPPFEVEI